MMPSSPQKQFLNGAFVSEEALHISVRDLGFTRGYAVFDFLVTYQGRPFLLSEHIDRLLQSASVIGLEVPWSKEQLMDWVLQTIAQNTDPNEKAVKIILSSGPSDSLVPVGEPTIAILVDNRHLLSSELFENGAGLIAVHHTRYEPSAKTNNYIEAVKQSRRAKKIGALEALYFDDQQVFETATSNIFAVIDGTLITPASNILHGITREVVINRLALDPVVSVEDFPLSTLLSADEVFVTASNKEILPITQIDGAPIGNGLVGPVTKHVMNAFETYIHSTQW